MPRLTLRKVTQLAHSINFVGALLIATPLDISSQSWQTFYKMGDMGRFVVYQPSALPKNLRRRALLWRYFFKSIPERRRLPFQRKELLQG